MLLPPARQLQFARKMVNRATRQDNISGRGLSNLPNLAIQQWTASATSGGFVAIEPNRKKDFREKDNRDAGYVLGSCSSCTGPVSYVSGSPRPSPDHRAYPKGWRGTNNCLGVLPLGCQHHALLLGAQLDASCAESALGSQVTE